MNDINNLMFDTIASYPPGLLISWSIIGGLVLLIGYLQWRAVAIHKRISRQRWGRTMLLQKRERDVQVKSIISDIITDGIEDAIYKKRLTSTEADQWYARFGKILDLTDLLPKIRGQRQLNLKEDIRSRVKGSSNPLPIPDAPTTRKLSDMFKRNHAL